MKKKELPMPIIDQISLDSIQKVQGEYCISIYMATTKVATEWKLNSVRLKNLLQKAEDDLKRLNCSTELLHALTAPLWDLQKDSKFLQGMQNGIALFSGPDFFRYYLFPVEIEERVVVSKEFHISPLLFLESRNKEYYLLAFSKNAISLYKADRFSLEKIAIPDSPENIEYFLRFDEEEEQLQFHTGTQQQQGKRAAVFHGQGTGTDKSQEKEKSGRYIHSLEKAVSKLLNGESAPLVLYTVEYLQGMYRKENSYGNLVHEGIHGNPEHAGDADLLNAGWSIVEKIVTQEMEEAVQVFENEQEDNKVTGKIDTTLKAAFEGKIHTLYISGDDALWGDFKEDTGKIIHHHKPEPGAQELLDTAARSTLKHGGKVHVLKKDQMPGQEKIAAVFRY
jgi:hypothetical protein